MKKSIKKELNLALADYSDNAKGIDNYGNYLVAKGMLMYRLSHFADRLLKGCGK